MPVHIAGAPEQTITPRQHSIETCVCPDDREWATEPLLHPPPLPGLRLFGPVANTLPLLKTPFQPLCGSLWVLGYPYCHQTMTTAHRRDLERITSDKNSQVPLNKVKGPSLVDTVISRVLHEPSLALRMARGCKKQKTPSYIPVGIYCHNILICTPQNGYHGVTEGAKNANAAKMETTQALIALRPHKPYGIGT